MAGRGEAPHEPCLTVDHRRVGDDGIVGLACHDFSWSRNHEPVRQPPVATLDKYITIRLTISVSVIDMDGVFDALADPTRRRVVQLLSQGPRRAGEIAGAAGMSGPAMSRHLRVLLHAGILSDERGSNDARIRIFRLRPDSLVAVQAWLDQVQAHWDEQLQAFKRHVEGGSR